VFDWTAKAVPGSTTKFLVAATPKARSPAYMRSDGFGIFTVYGRISVMDLHFWESLASQKGKGRRATSTGRTQGEGALRSDVTVPLLIQQIVSHCRVTGPYFNHTFWPRRHASPAKLLFDIKTRRIDASHNNHKPPLSRFFTLFFRPCDFRHTHGPPTAFDIRKDILET
jgi:hypothetical protein